MDEHPPYLFDQDREVMRTLSSMVLGSVLRNSVRLPRQVRVFANDYSVDPGAIARIVDIEADLEVVTLSAEGQLLARHERRWARHQIFTYPAHVDKAVRLRRPTRGRHVPPLSGGSTGRSKPDGPRPLRSET